MGPPLRCDVKEQVWKSLLQFGGGRGRDEHDNLMSEKLHWEDGKYSSASLRDTGDHVDLNCE